MTVGSMARIQVKTAQVYEKYGSQLDSLYSSATKTSSYAKYSNSTDTLNSLLNSSALKSKSDEFRSQFSSLYKSIYGISDDDSTESTVSTRQAIKSASASAGGSAESIKSFANKLSYGGDLDVDAYKAQAQSFVDNYNALIDKLSDSDNQSILQKGVLLVNTAKVYSSSFKRAGITVGADNKLTLSDDLSNIKALDVKTLFGTNGFSDKLIQKARDINSLSGGYGVFTKSAVSSSSSSSSTTGVDNSGTLKELTTAIKDKAEALSSYVKGLGEDGNEFNADDYKATAKNFIDQLNSLIEEANKSNNSSVSEKGYALQSTVKSYAFALERAGISVGKDGKLSIGDVSKLTEDDVKYVFNSSLIDKITQKADQINSLVSSASAMGYSANSAASYAYNVGALFNVYA